MAQLIDEVVEIVLDDMLLDTSTYGRRVLRYAKQVEQSILNFTHLAAVPKGLLYVWVDMTTALMKAVLGDKDENIGGTREVQVTAVQEGDTSVSFGGKETNLSVIEQDALASIVFGATAQLVQYRVVKWG